MTSNKITHIAINDNKYEIYDESSYTELSNLINSIETIPGGGENKVLSRSESGSLIWKSEQNIWTGSQEEFDTIEDKDPNTIYYVIEE